MPPSQSVGPVGERRPSGDRAMCGAGGRAGGADLSQGTCPRLRHPLALEGEVREMARATSAPLLTPPESHDPQTLSDPVPNPPKTFP